MTLRLSTVLLLCLLPASASAATVAPINAVVGDKSWVERFGHRPTEGEARALDDLRHEVHLAWIEGRLRSASVEHLSSEARSRRAALLDALADYRRRGVHPRNPRAERLPRWLDEQGRVCAVGYLIERTVGRAFLRRLNERHEYEYLMELEDSELDAWIATSGFTRRELASIQPSIGGGPLGGLSLEVTEAEAQAGFAGAGAAVLYAVNIGLFSASAMARLHPPRGPDRAEVPITQLLFGVAQLFAASALLGLSMNGAIGGPWQEPVAGVSASVMFMAAIQIVDGAFRLAVPLQSD